VDAGLNTIPAAPFLIALVLFVLAIAPRVLASPRIGLIVGVTTLPILWVGGTHGVLLRLALPDVVTGLTLVAAASALAGGRLRGAGEVRLPWTVTLGLIGLGAAMALSLPSSETLGRSAVEMTAFLVNAVLFLLFPVLLRTRADVDALVTAWERAAWIAVVGAGIGLALLIAGRLDTPFTEGHKVASFGKKSSQLSAVLLPMVPFVAMRYAAAATRRGRALRGLLLAAMLVTFAATGSRLGLMIGGSACGLALLLPALRSLPRWRPAHVVLVLSAAGLLLAIAAPRRDLLDALPFAFRRSLSFVTDPGDVRTLSPYRGYQIDAWRVAAVERPWTGVGVGATRARATSYAPASFTPYEIHSTALGVWAETGLPGAASLALLFAGVLGAAAALAVRGRDAAMRSLGVALVASIVLLLIYGLGNYGLRMRHLWAVLGFAIAAWNVDRLAAAPGPAGTAGPGLTSSP
jgi:O-antigen ligase